MHCSLGSLVHAYRNCRKPQDNAKIDDSEHCSRAELLATHVKRLETLDSTSWVCVQCDHPFLVCNECYIVRMIGPCNRQWHRLKMLVDVEYIPSCCIEKMHLHAAIPVETEVVNEPTSAENFSLFLNLHVHVLS